MGRLGLGGFDKLSPSQPWRRLKEGIIRGTQNHMIGDLGKDMEEIMKLQDSRHCKSLILDFRPFQEHIPNDVPFGAGSRQVPYLWKPSFRPRAGAKTGLIITCLIFVHFCLLQLT